jgi:HEAT repeat protein
MAAVEEIERNPALLTDWLRAQKLEPLLEVLLEPRVRRSWRLRVIREVPRFGDRRVVPALAQALADDDFGVRGRAATALADCFLNGMPVQGANAALLGCAEERDEYVRRKALYALSVIGEQKAVPALLDIAERSPVKNYRRSAAAALGRLRAPEAETFFVRYLDDPEDAPWAATWLAEIGTEASVDSLRAAADRDPANNGDYGEALEAIERRKSNAAA